MQKLVVKTERERREKMNGELNELAKTNWGESFIISYNDFFDYNSELHLTPEQFYMYSLLVSLTRYNGSIITNLSVIEECLPNSYSNNKNYNRKKIKESLNELYNLNIIEVSNEDLINIKPNDILTIYIDYDYIDSKKINKGFEKILIESFYNSEESLSFYVCCCIMRYEDNVNKNKLEKFTEGFSCSYENWGNILNCTERNAIRIINKLIDKEIIYVNIGDYVSDNNQNINTYSIFPIEDANKTHMTKIKEYKNSNKTAFGSKEELPF